MNQQMEKEQLEFRNKEKTNPGMCFVGECNAAFTFSFPLPCSLPFSCSTMPPCTSLPSLTLLSSMCLQLCVAMMRSVFTTPPQSDSIWTSRFKYWGEIAVFSSVSIMTESWQACNHVFNGFWNLGWQWDLRRYLQKKGHAHGKLLKCLGIRVEIAKIFRSTNRTEKIKVK